MIGMALRQTRAALIATAALTGAIVAVLAVHGLQARSVSSKLVQACTTPESVACQMLQDELWGMYQTLTPYLGYLTITTVLVATFWGAPLISREVESGTATLAWCQSVTRRRWLATRLIVGASTLATLGLILGFTVTWWLGSFTATPHAGERVLTTVRLHGPLLPAMWVSGFLIGALIGALVRRVLPAMAVTSVVTLAAAIAVNLTSGLYAASPVGELRVLADQCLQALPVLAVGAVAALVAFRQVRRVSV